MTSDVTAITAARALTVLKQMLPQYSRNELEAFFAHGRVRYDGRRIKKSERIPEGGVLTVDCSGDGGIVANPDAVLSIVHEDESIIALAKTANMHTVPLMHDDADTLMNAVAAHCGTLPASGGELNAGSINRLDFETTGLVLAAKTDAAFAAMSTEYRSGRAEKMYLARVSGSPPDILSMEDMLVKDRSGGQERMRVGARGLPARAELVRIGAVGSDSFVLLTLITGVRHQLRVQLSSRGFPIVGDALYGGREYQNMLLHALSIETLHPITGKRMLLCALPPDAFWADTGSL